MKPFLIGVVSDTHMDSYNDELLFLNDTVFEDISHVFHCGDMVNLSVLDAFYNKEITGVSGNMDRNDVKEKFPFLKKISIEGINFCILHGIGYGSGLLRGLVKEFPETDVFVFGHTHRPEIKMIDDYIFFNPGSFSHNRAEYPKRSAGIIKIKDNREIDFCIIDLGKIADNKFKIIEVVDNDSIKRDRV